MSKLELARGLSDKQQQDIKELDKECCEHEKLNMKLNWDMLEKRPVEEVNDFLYYDGSRLAGFLGIYGMGDKPKEIEVTGMVHPDYRRRGIFRELFNAARQECMNRGTERILLITERSSEAGTKFVTSIGARYAFSEYRMKFEGEALSYIPRLGISLRKAEARDFAELSHLDAVSFGLDEGEMEDNISKSQYESAYVAELGGQSIGKIGTLMEGKDGYIFGFVIKPEYRGRGYGREVLSLALQKLISEKVKSVLLEVAVKNERALWLYKSCGFGETTIYDYYEIIP